MADIKISQLTAKASDLANTDEFAIAEDDGAGGFVSKKITGAEIKGGLQETLVSGTNIKTINGTSVLGSGDLAVGGGGGGGGIQSPIIGPVFNFATSASITAKTPSSNTMQSNEILFHVYYPAQDYTCGSFRINVRTASTGVGRIMVYSAVHPTVNDGRPGALLYSSTDLDMTTTGVKSVTTTFNFTAGTVYYLAFQCEASPNVTAIHKDALIPCGTNGTLLIPAFRQINSSYSSGAPNPAAVNTFDTSAQPMIIMYKQ